MAAGDCGSGVSLSGGIGAVMSDLVVDGKSAFTVRHLDPIGLVRLIHLMVNF